MSTVNDEEFVKRKKNGDVISQLEYSINEVTFNGTKAAEITMERKCRLPNVIIAQIRQKLNLTQKQFATVLGVSPRTVQDWECGRNNPTPTARNLMYLINDDPTLADKLISYYREKSWSD